MPFVEPDERAAKHQQTAETKTALRVNKMKPRGFEFCRGWMRKVAAPRCQKEKCGAKEKLPGFRKLFQRTLICCLPCLRLNGGDGHSIDNIFCFAAAREIVGRLVESLKNRTDRRRAGQSFSEFVTDVP